MTQQQQTTKTFMGQHDRFRLTIHPSEPWGFAELKDSMTSATVVLTHDELRQLRKLLKRSKKKLL